MHPVPPLLGARRRGRNGDRRATHFFWRSTASSRFQGGSLSSSSCVKTLSACAVGGAAGAATPFGTAMDSESFFFRASRSRFHFGREDSPCSAALASAACTRQQ